jgi:uncharacterized protein involved in exopolysaccharide biosynthesis
VILDLETVVTQVRRQFKLFSLIVAAAFLISVVVALLTRPVYRAEAVVSSAGEDGGLSGLGGLAGQLGGGGLASLAGGLLGGGSRNWNKAIAVLHSRHLIEELVTRENLLPVLFQKNGWRMPWAKAAGSGELPTMGDAVLAFQRRILQVREDPKTSLVTVRVEWFDPQTAATWANELVALADNEERAHAVNDAQTSLSALQREFATTEGVELRGAIARLIEEQLKAKMVAGARAQFAYRFIDRAVPADLDKRVQPTRTTMVLAGTLAGVLLGVLIVVARFELARRKLPRHDEPV